MKVEQIYTGCLAQGAYYIASEGEAAVIDASVDPEVYLSLAQAGGTRIRYVLDTHIHADHISSALKLSQMTEPKLSTC